MAPGTSAASNLAILVTADEQMQAVPLAEHIVADDVDAHPIDTITARDGVVFWFNSTTAAAVNKMATLNLYAATELPAHAVPLLHGTVLITGINGEGDPIGLSQPQINLLQARPAPSRWAHFILQLRSQRAHRRRDAPIHR